MIRPIEKSVLIDLIARKDEESVRAALKPYHPFDIANMLPELAPDQPVAVLLALPAKPQA